MTERIALVSARVALSVLLLILIPLIFHLAIPALSQTPELIAWAFLLVAALRMIQLALSPKPRILDLAFWLFVYVFFGVAAISQISGHKYPLSSGDYSNSQLITTQLRIAIGIAAYALGIWLWNRSSSSEKPTAWWDRLVVSESRCRVIGIVGVVVAVLLIAKTGLKFFFESRDALALTLFNASGKVAGLRVYDLASKSAGSLKQLALTVPSFVVMVYLIQDRRWLRHKVLFAAVIAVSVVTNNPISNARYWTGVVLIGIVAACMDLSKKSRHVFFALGLLVTTVFSLSYLGVFRTSSPVRSTSTQSTSVTQQLIDSPDYGMFQQDVNTTLYVSSHGYTNGSQLAGSVLVYVPRSIWHSKPGATGQLVEQEVGLNNLFSASLWSEFYIDFGYPELIIGFMLVGYAFSYLDNVFYRSRSTAVKIIIPIAATYSIIFLRGSLQPTIAYGVPIFIVLFLCLRRRTPTSHSAITADLSQAKR